MKAQQLKNAILQLAIQGKLVPQDPNDEPASVLLEKIKQEKEKLIAEGKIKKSKKASDNPPYLNESEFPFEIPESWVWVRLGDIGIYKKGPFGSSLTKNLFIPKTQNAIKVYEQKNAIKKNVSLGEYYIPYDYFISHMQSFEVFAGDIIVSCAGTIGETFVMPLNLERGIINQALMRMNISKNIDIDYFLIYFDYILKGSSKLNSSGTAIKNIPPFSVFKKLSFALPPLSEQKRIVAKIEELLPFIEQYAKKEQELTALHQAFPEQLKKSILQAAIQGKLTEQNPNDELAVELVKRIQAEKERLILEKKIKKPKQRSEIIVRDNSHYEIVDGVERCIDDEIPFEIPESWCWVRLGDITSKITDGSHNPPPNNLSGIPILSAANIFDNAIQFDTATRWVSDMDWEIENKRTDIQVNDILLTIVGSIGRTAVVKNLTKFALQRSVAIIKPMLICSEYISYALQAPLILGFMARNSKGTAQKGIYLSMLSELLLPLPPFSEQKKVVIEIEKLFSIIDNLK